MADPAAESSEEKKDSEQLDLFAEKTEKVASKLDQVTSQLNAIASQVSQPQRIEVAQPQAKVPDLTEEQVEQLVATEQITRAQANAYLHKRVREQARAEARQESQAQLNALREEARGQVNAGKIQKYVEAIPELSQRGSAEWNKVARRYKELVGEGLPDTLVTELTALREIYGADPAEHTRVVERTKERATQHAETSSSTSTRQRSNQRRSAADVDFSDVPGDVKTYVQRMINIRQYSGLSDPRAHKYVENWRRKHAS